MSNTGKVNNNFKNEEDKKSDAKKIINNIENINMITEILPELMLFKKYESFNDKDGKELWNMSLISSLSNKLDKIKELFAKEKVSIEEFETIREPLFELNIIITDWLMENNKLGV